MLQGARDFLKRSIRRGQVSTDLQGRRWHCRLFTISIEVRKLEAVPLVGPSRKWGRKELLGPGHKRQRWKTNEFIFHSFAHSFNQQTLTECQ